MTAKIIFNPYAARWKARARQAEVEAALKNAGVSYEVALSEKRSDCMKLAAQAVRDGFSPIVAAGGDGTIGEVINGMASVTTAVSDSLTTFGLLPLGTANDLAHNLHLPLELGGAARVIAAGNTRPLDLCQVNERYFINNAALGLEPAITTLQADIHWLKGVPRYMAAALKGIWRNESWDVDMVWDDGRFSGPITLISVGNGAITGGLFYMTPHANAFDGKLTFTYGHRSSRSALLRMLPRAMKPDAGSFVEEPDIHEIETRELTVRLKQPSPIHADGELYTASVTEAYFKIYPGRVPLLIP
ncbi:MAG: diacylglycerol kinase family lipid kinase [Anaerolineales bacterium]|nr:diacylglycerol kinase family lipid kinase [Anaerolineales bacterium]